MKKILFLLLCTVSIYGQTSTGQEQSFPYGIVNESLQTITTPTYIGTFGTDGTQGKIPSAYIAKTAAVQDSLNKKLNLPTGFLYGLQLSINADTTKFNIAAGYYTVTDFSNLAQPVVKIMYYPGATGLTPAYLATANSTYVALDINGAVVSSASPFTDAQRRTLAIVGNVVHSNHTTINVVNEIKAPIVAIGNQLHDFMKAIGFLNESGNVYSANGANLQINKSVGDIFGMGINASDYLSPHKLTIPAQTALTFAYRFQNGTQLADTQNINPNIYDVGGTSTATPSNKWTIQRINLFQSGLSRIQPGQTVYNSFNDAVVALPTQPFVTEQNIADNAVFRCYLIVQQGTTNLASAVSAGTALFVPVDKFGNVIGNGSVALTYANVIAALGFTPENVALKQNSLAVDATNLKYPTVTAVNAGLNLKANDLDVVHKTENETIGGEKIFNNKLKVLNKFAVGEPSILLDTAHLTQFNAGTTVISPIAIRGGNASIEIFNKESSPTDVWAFGINNPTEGTTNGKDFNFYKADPAFYALKAKITGESNFFIDGTVSGKVTTITPTVSGQATRIAYLTKTKSTEEKTLVIFFHGSSENENTFFDNLTYRPVSDLLIAEGCIVSASFGSGDSWGNQSAQDDYYDLYTYVSSLFNIKKVIFIGQSMGGLVSLNLLASNRIPNVQGWYGIYPVTNLNAAYYNEGFSSNIESAYGFVGSSNYASATSGFDPYLLSTNLFANKKYSFIASADDTVVLKTLNSDLFNTKINSVSYNSEVILATGQHGDASHFLPLHAYNFTKDFNIIGQGESGYVSVFDSKKSIIKSNIFKNSNGVGIGTINPNDFLHLTKNQATPLKLILENLSASTSAGASVSFRFNGTETGSVYNKFNGIDFQTDITSSSIVRILNNGILETGVFSSSGLKLNSLSGTGPAQVMTDAAGNLTRSVGYKVYTALITQTGTNAPVATVLENTLGGTIVWTRADIGSFTATLTGSFPSNKVVVFITNQPTGGAADNFKGGRATNDTITVITTNGTSSTDSLLSNSSIEIRVYN